MKVIGILLLAMGGIGAILAARMYGDVGLAAGMGCGTAILSGIGFLVAARRLPAPVRRAPVPKQMKQLY
jgi:hypothetical protein